MRIVAKQREETIFLHQDGNEQVLLQDCRDLRLRIEVGAGVHACVWIAYDGAELTLHSEVNLHENCDVQILFWNRLHGQLNMDVAVIGAQNAKAQIGFGDLAQQTSTYHIRSELSASGMQVKLWSACLAGWKHWTMECVHHAAHSEAVMQNFAVVREHGDYLMQASGRIVKGAYGSSSHQTSRVLTLSQKQRSEVVPILYIDENDVKASHATTMGQPDEAQLYYLHSRGLSDAQALGLLTYGYLMPIAELLDNEEWQIQLRAEIEEKVMNDGYTTHSQ
ncbi:MAG: SufD family Fe-S cluster assembly protein [Erysipelotrichaceae bacterium]|nr:SufD family Fe-S cluster assembly protein [Erysipelotrichaceae bacterium]